MAAMGDRHHKITNKVHFVRVALLCCNDEVDVEKRPMSRIITPWVTTSDGSQTLKND